MKAKLSNLLLRIDKSKFLILVVFYAILAFLALRGFILEPGTIGHNWDWFVSPLPSQLQSGVSSFYSWNDGALGFGVSGASYAPFNFVWANLGYLGLDGGFVSKFLLFITIVISGITMFYLIDDILRREFSKKEIENRAWIFFPSLLAGFFYALSPFLFNDFIGGVPTQFFSYSLLPLALYLFRKLASSGAMRHIVLLGIVLSIIAISFQNLFFISLILFLYILVQKSRLRLLRNLVITYGLLFVLSLFWVLPLLYNGFSSAAQVPFNPVAMYNVTQCVPSLHQIFIGTGFWDRHFFSGSIAVANKNLWLLCSFGLLILILSSLFLLGKERRKEAFFWGILLVPALIFATAGKAPLGNMLAWMYQHISYMIFFRTTYHLIVPPTLFLTILIGMGTFCFLSHFRLNRVPIYLVLFALMTVWVSPFFTGNLGLNYLESRKGGNFVATFQISPGLEGILERLDNDDGNFRVLYLPMSYSPYYLETEYQREGQGGDPVVWNTSSVIHDLPGNIYASQYITMFQDSLYNKGAPRDAAKLLGMANGKYIILRKDVIPTFGPFVNTWDYQEVYDTLKQTEGIELIEEHKYVSLWENKDYLPHIYPVSSLIYLPQGADSLPAIAVARAFSPESAYFWDAGVFNQWREKTQVAYLLPEEWISGVSSTKEGQISGFESESDVRDWWGDGNFWMASEEPFSRLSWNSDSTYIKEGSHSLRAFYNYDTFLGWGWINLQFAEEQDWSDFESLSLWIYYPETPPKDCNIELHLLASSWDVLYKKTASIEHEGWNYLTFGLTGSDVDKVKYFRLIFTDSQLNYKNMTLYLDDLWLESGPLIAGEQYSHGLAISLTANSLWEPDIKITPSAAYRIGAEASAQSAGTLTFTIGDQNLTMPISRSDEMTWVWSSTVNLAEGDYRLQVVSDVDVIIDSIVITSAPRAASSSPTSSVSFHKVSPVKYQVQVETPEPFVLAFLESYDPNWKAYINGGKAIPEEDHLLINGYANAWYVDPTALGVGDEFTVTLYYQLQRVADIGLIITGIALAGSIGCLVWDRRKGRHGKSRAESGIGSGS